MTDKDLFEVVEISTWHDLKSAFNELSPNTIYRGQSQAKWDLESSIDRISILNKTQVEKRLISEIKKRLNFFPQTYRPKSDLEILLYLQHYGAPTRLIDFTHSPYVATFFALKSKEKDLSSIYAIDAFHYPILVQTKEFEKFRFSSEIERDLLNFELSDSNVFNELVLSNSEEVPFVVPLEIPLHHERSLPQASTFLVQGTLTKSFLENYSAILQEIQFPHELLIKPKKFIFPNELRELALVDLNLMNINYLSLFPGLDGLAKEAFLNCEISEYSIKNIIKSMA